MDYSQAKAYIEKPLDYSDRKVAIFSEDAMKYIYEFSTGTPRLVNYACTQALIYAYQNCRPLLMTGW